jgi:two-component system, OmpR family, KDP operon response regulator KdpE
MNEKLRILVVDDERPIRRFLHAALRGEYNVFEAATGEEALAETISARPDIIILDLGLPDMDGVELTRKLREWTNIPIIVVSVREREEEKIQALDAGVDDYLTKPFGIGELMARLRVALRKSFLPNNEPVFQTGDISVDLARHEVKKDGQVISLTPTEYDIFQVLIQNAGKVITHIQLIHKVWGTSNETDAHLLRVNISNLRRKIEVDPTRPSYITTEPGIGYRLKTLDVEQH